MTAGAVSFRSSLRGTDGTFVPMDPAERFWGHVDRADLFGCWSWRGTRDPEGYGRFHVGGRGTPTVRAHRHSYELLVGPIPDDLVIDHLCRNTSCVNPAHLEPVTTGENSRRGIHRYSSHCPRGHAYTPDNLVRNGAWGKKCKRCHRERQAARYARRRGTAA